MAAFRRRSPLPALLLALGLARADAAQTPDADAAAVRAEFRAALEAVPKVPAESRALRDYALYPYLDAARLRHALSRVADDRTDPPLEARIRAFLAAQGDAPVARELRQEWLSYLGVRERWADFETDAPPALPDLSLRCHAYNARLERRDLDGLREAVLADWLEHRDAPTACRRIFAWLDTPNRLTDAEVEWRGRYAARTRRPLPESARDLPPPRQALLRLWERLMRQPERELDRFLDAKRPEDLAGVPEVDVAEALVEAFLDLARRDSRKARPLYPRLLRHDALDDPHRQRARVAYALGLAYDADPDALAIFRELPEAALDAASREWRVRAALRQDARRHALAWIEAMPEAQRNEVRWQYWRARLLEQRGRGDEARALYEAAAREREYYAFLAAERLGRTPDLRPIPLAEDAALRRHLEALPPIQRARELLAGELPDLAMSELRYAVRDAPPAVRAQAARLASTWEWHRAAVLVISELQLWDDLALRFPLPHDDLVAAAARETGFAAEWIYAVLRTESLYDARAVSGAGALGLLQLRLPTARQVARNLKRPLPSRDDLFRPEVNIALGAHYLRQLHERFQGRLPLTLAAYNAGPHRAMDWLPHEPVEADAWIESIPYNETRAYVQRALSTLVVVSWRRDGKPAPLLPLLQPIGPARQDAAS